MKSRLEVRKEITQPKVRELGLKTIDDNRHRVNAQGKLVINQPTMYILDSEVASGKTYGIEELINNDCKSSITFVEQIYTANKIALNTKAMAITSQGDYQLRNEKGKLEDCTVLEYLKYKVIPEGTKHVVMTHSALRSLLQTKEYQGIFYEFEAIFVDELFDSCHSEAYSWKDLRDMADTFRFDVVNNGRNALGAFIDNMNAIIKDENTDDITLLDMGWANGLDLEGIEQELILLIKKQKKKGGAERIRSDKGISLIRQLMRGDDHIYYLHKAGRDIHFVATKSYLPEKRSCLICSDNAMKDASMKAMAVYAQSQGVNIEVETLERGSWDTHNIHWQIASTSGKRTLTEFNNEPHAFLDKMDSYDKCLFTLPKKITVQVDSAIDVITDEDIEDDNKEALIQKQRWQKEKRKHKQVGSTIQDVVSWGRHKGTALFSDNNIVCIPTLFHQPDHVYSSKWNSQARNDFTQVEYDKWQLPLLSVFAHVKNLIGRVKRSEQELNDRVDVFICFPTMEYAEKMLALFKEDMPECHIDVEPTYWWKELELTLLEGMIERMGNEREVALHKLVDDGKLLNNMRNQAKDEWSELRNQAVKAGYWIHKPNHQWILVKQCN